MSRTQKNVINIFSLLIMCCGFWTLNLYPRHVLEFVNWTSAISAAFNLAFFVLFDFLLISVFSLRETVFCDSVFKRKNFKILFKLLAAELIFDLAFIGVGKIGGFKGAVIAYSAIILEWFIVYFIAADKKVVIFKSRGAAWAVCLAVAAVFAAGVALGGAVFAEKAGVLQRFAEGSPVIEAVERNSVHLHSLIMLAVDFFTGAALFSAHMFCIRSPLDVSDKKTVVFVRCASVFLLFAIAAAVKIAVVPSDSVKNIRKTYGGRAVTGDELFTISTTDLWIYRYESGRRTDRLVYTDRSVSVKPLGSGAVKASIPKTYNLFDYAFEGEDRIISKSTRVYCSRGEPRAFLYVGSILCYYENGMPSAVKVGDICGLGKSEAVVSACENLLESGNVFMFEYCRDYLLKYDKSFIGEYVGRYSRGEFTGLETKWMEKNFYDPEFLKESASGA